jgi:UDP-N-acetylglucosamine transferase subunit ALG13
MTAAAGFERREPAGPAGPRVVVTVGTDHHPFNRLIRWVNDWLDAHPERIPGFFVQSGPASVLPGCRGAQFLDVSQRDVLLDSADVIVCHGGPGCIADAWARGMIPIVVPRLPKLGEIVDEHQVDFCRKLAELHRVWVAQTPAEFAGLLELATHGDARFRSSVPAADVEAAVARFGELVEELVSRSRHRLPLIHRGPRIRSRPGPGTGAADDPAILPSGLLRAASTTWHAPGAPARTGLAGKASKER